MSDVRDLVFCPSCVGTCSFWTKESDKEDLRLQMKLFTFTEDLFLCTEEEYSMKRHT